MKKIAKVILLLSLVVPIFASDYVYDPDLPILSYEQYDKVKYECIILEETPKYVVIKLKGKCYLVPISK